MGTHINHRNLNINAAGERLIGQKFVPSMENSSERRGEEGEDVSAVGNLDVEGVTECVAEADSRATASQEMLIRDEINSNDMISELKSLSSLAALFENAEMKGFYTGIQYLSSRYNTRQVRGDGNCFYRSLLYSYLEQILNGLLKEDVGDLECVVANDELTRIKAFIDKSKADLVEIGYEEFAIETFHDMFVELLDGLPSMTSDSLLSMFQEDGSGDYYTWYMRVLCACYMRRDSERFLPFIEDGCCVDMKSYCDREVEPMGKECEQLQIISLTEYMGVKVNIHYVDGRPFDKEQGPSVISLPESASGIEPKITVHLLYRPGHYDILYPV